MVHGGEAVLEGVARGRALPSSVTGPRERAPLRREASIGRGAGAGFGHVGALGGWKGLAGQA